MTQAEIDSLLEAMQSQFEQSGDDADRPGVINFETNDWVERAKLPTCCTSLGRGIRYRGVRVLISRDRTSGVLSRGEAQAAGHDGGPYEDLKSREDAAV